MSKIIKTIRIEPADLLGCYEMLAVVYGKESVENVPVSTILGKFISHMLTTYRDEGFIPSYEEESLAFLELAKYIPRTKITDIIKDLPVADGVINPKGTPFLSPTQMAENIVIPKIQQAEQELDGEVLNPLFTGGSTRDEPTDNIQKPTKIVAPWLSLEKYPLESIRKLHPEDGFLIKADDEDDEVLLFAIQCAYKRFNPAGWASDGCRRLVEELYDKFKEWEEEDG